MKKVLPYITILTAITFWGISYISATICIRYITPTVLASTRCMLGALVLFTIWKMSSKSKQKIQKKDYLRFLISGFFGMNAYFVCEMSALKYIEAPIASLIVAAIPIFALVVDRILIKNKLTVFKIAGVIISVAGVIIIISSDLSSVKSAGKIYGYLFMLGSVVSWVTFNYISKPLHETYSSLTITTWQMILAAVTLVPYIVFGKGPQIALDTTFIVNFLFLAIFCSATAILFYVYSLGKLGIVTTTLFVNVQPFITVVVSAVTLHIFLTKEQMIGGVLVICALYISSIVVKPKKEIVYGD